MIVTLTGLVAEKNADLVVVDVSGVGYGVYVTSEDHGKLPLGQQTKLNIYEHIRENSHDLFGFTSLDTKRIFEQLLGVSGIGPKMAINVLSIGSGNAVRQAIASGDTKFIQGAPGVGKRVAERIVVDLKDKVGLEGVDLAGTGLLQSETTLHQDEAVEALVSLGYSTLDAVNALKQVPTELPIEDRIKQALKYRS